MLEPSLQLKEKEQKEKEARALEQKLEEQRRQATDQMVTDAIQRDKEATEKEVVLAMDSDANLCSDSSSSLDDFDQAASDCDQQKPPQQSMKRQAKYEAWKVRELRRILRDRDELEAYEKELAEIERRRKMTDEER